MKKIQLLPLLLFTFYYVCAQENQVFPVKDIAVQWQSAEPNYNRTNKTRGVFVLKNQSSSQIFPAGGWTIYFNICRHVETISPLPTNAAITHYNGDIYTITPGKNFTPLLPGDSTKIDFLFDRVILNPTDKPYGLYLVWDNDIATGHTITNYSAGPLSPDIPGYVTPQKVYDLNSAANDIAENELPPVFPSPNSYRYTNGECIISKNLVIEADKLFESERLYCKETLDRLWSSKKNKQQAAVAKIIITTAPLKKEAYELSVEPGIITIKAGDATGAFYGIQSLLSSLPAMAWKGNNTNISIPCFEIKDEPRFNNRSLSLDVARNFKDKKTIYKVLDLMAMYKMNVLHFHCTDDEGWRIQIPGLPELTDIGSVRGHVMKGKNNMLPPSYGSGPVAGNNAGSGYYTRADFIDILKFATERHIQVTPEIESPGHARAAVVSMKARWEKYMQLGNKAAAEEYLLNDINDSSVYSSAQEWTDNVMCVALPSVYTFMEKVTDELIAMYKEAGAPFVTLHIGGDEVPAGVWERSPACAALPATEPSVKDINALWLYYFGRMITMLHKKGLQLSAWEEGGMRKTKLDGKSTMIVNSGFANTNMQLHVWNNVTGWGAEDLPYRLANAGYKVMLSPVSNNYLDLAYYRHPDEPGYYWGGFQDIDKPFYFIPYDYYKTSKEDPEGNPINRNVFVGKDRLTDFGKSNIVGVEGLLWEENLPTVEKMEFMLLPKLLGVAERAWAKDPAWSTEKDSVRFEKLYNHDWSVFVNQVGKKELPRLDYVNGGYQYRIPPPGAMQKDGNVYANCQFPGLAIRYTTDGSEPTVKSVLYRGAIADKGTIKIKTFSSNGRSSRTITLENR